MTEVKNIALSRLILHEDNPRFEGILNEEAAIAALCATEKVLDLARDIAENGLSPLDRFMAFREDPNEEPANANYVVAEGNRRLCALKLLKDPRRAPSAMRAAFQRAKTNAKIKLPRLFEVVIEEDEDERRKWIERAHAGTLSGKGRKAWNTEQKSRHFKNPRNLRGLAVLDYAVERGFVSKDEKDGRLSHIVRLIGNPVMRATLGLHFEKDPTEPYRDRPLEDFEKLIKWLINEALVKDLGSQAGKKEINDKANKLEVELGCGSQRLSQPEALSNDLITSQDDDQPDNSVPNQDCAKIDATTQHPPKNDKNDSAKDDSENPQDKSESAPLKPNRPEPNKVMPYSNDLYKLLQQLNNYKLQSLYYSISSINLKNHVPSLYAITWSFLDSLSVALGRSDDGNISQHWQRKNLLKKDLSYSSNTATTVAGSFDRIRTHGNDTKHHPFSAGFDAQQLSSDWSVILPVLEHDLREHLSK